MGYLPTIDFICLTTWGTSLGGTVMSMGLHTSQCLALRIISLAAHHNTCMWLTTDLKLIATRSLANCQPSLLHVSLVTLRDTLLIMSLVNKFHEH